MGSSKSKERPNHQRQIYNKIIDATAPLEISYTEISETKKGLEYLNELSKTFLIILQNEYESVQ